jgi:hypothetical protein
MTGNLERTEKATATKVEAQAFWGLAARREGWRLTWKGRFLATLLILGTLWIVQVRIRPFLAVTNRIPAGILVVEGWTPPNTLRQVAAEFRQGNYQRLILMRPIVDDTDKYESGRYNGDYMANLLIQYGVPQEQETTLFPIVAQKDRTYHSALDAKRWLSEHGMQVKSLDVATLGPHARRSRLMYEKAFGDEVRIGIIALANREYDPAHWWRTSEGVRDVIGETIAYIYARIFFHAPREN